MFQIMERMTKGCANQIKCIQALEADFKEMTHDTKKKPMMVIMMIATLV